jgi:hypothetical protein
LSRGNATLAVAAQLPAALELEASAEVASVRAADAVNAKDLRLID